MKNKSNLTEMVLADVIAGIWWVGVGVSIAVLSHQINLALDRRSLKKFVPLDDYGL